MSTPKHITVNGVRFCRDDATGYYLNGTLNVRAHRQAYEDAFGPIPYGFHVHHIDGDKSNNRVSNLALMTASEHATHHGLERAATEEWTEWARGNLAAIRHLAAEWHRSPEGREWHRQHAHAVAANTVPQTFVCDQCGSGYEAKPNGPPHRFCSNACKSAARRAAGVDNETRVCACCGSAFTANRYAATQTCGRSCANRMRARK